VLYSGYYAPLAVRHQRGGRRIYYCHALPRFAYDLTEYYRARFPVGSRWAFDLAMAWLRREYGAAIARMDVVVANSENVRGRLKKYLGLDARVIHPPVATDRFRWLGDGGYYLSTARLTGSKRVETIVEAFLGMPGRQLVVVSGGPQLGRLRHLAGAAANIRILGWQSEEALRDWIGNARAIVYAPIDEDFGMSPVEAMAAGKPVVGVAAGGLLETVVDGETGVLLEEPLDAGRLKAAVERLEALGPAAMRAACERRAAQFSEAAFLERMRAVLDEPGHGKR
jgi:glycosyltransferase involved in cell wall biosynthesis